MLEFPNYTIYQWMFAVAVGLLSSYLAVEDWRFYEVSGEPCLAGWIYTVAYCVLFKLPPVFLLVTIVLAIIFYLPFDIPYLGDADILVANMMAVTLNNFIAFFIYAVVLLPICIIYSFLYAKFKNKNYRWFAKECVPAIPVFAASWWFTLVALALIQYL